MPWQWERGMDAAICIYGILLAGGCYVPLDISNPAQRLAYIIEDADPAMIIGKGAQPEWLNPNYPWCDFNTVISTDQNQSTSAEPLIFFESTRISHDSLYIRFNRSAKRRCAIASSDEKFFRLGFKYF